MAVLKQLCVIYLAAASAFAGAIVLDRNPALDKAVRHAAALTAEAGGTAAVAVNDHVLRPGWVHLADAGSRAIDFVAAAMSPPPRAAKAPPRVAKAPPARTPARPKPAAAPRPAAPPAAIAAKPAPAAGTASGRVARAVSPVPSPSAAPALRPQIIEPSRSKVTIAIAPPPVPPVPKPSAPKTKVTIAIAPKAPAVAEPPAAPATSPAEIARVEQRLKDNLTDALYANFDLFLYVSKAASGPVAQRMYVFAKRSSGDLTLRYDWPVSTGREKVEYNKAGWKLPSYTPAGYYELDPHRMYKHYRSIQWGTPMPYAMFFDWVHDGNRSGLAIHAAHGDDIALLGKRASGGCIHLAPKDAAILFQLIRTQYKGPVPRFAYDRKTRTISNRGELMRDARGDLRFSKGYRVLVFIENYGGSDTVATIM